MIDTHSHLLWEVDDGPSTFDQAYCLVEQAVKEGITEIIATPHCLHPLYSVNFPVVQEKVRILQQEILKNNMPLIIHPGHEVRISDKIIELYHSKQIHTLANSNYLLLELPSETVPFYTKYIIQALLDEGIIPIIAHPERNKAIIENPSRLENLVQIGATAQITSSSLTGHFGRRIQKFALYLVNTNLVHTYGSDVHNLTNRPFCFEEGLLFLEKKKKLDAIDRLLENNARIIANKPFI